MVPNKSCCPYTISYTSAVDLTSLVNPMPWFMERRVTLETWRVEISKHFGELERFALTSTSTNGVLLLNLTRMGKNSESLLACASNSKLPELLLSSTAPMFHSRLSPLTSYIESKEPTLGSSVS